MDCAGISVYSRYSATNAAAVSNQLSCTWFRKVSANHTSVPSRKPQAVFTRKNWQRKPKTLIWAVHFWNSAMDCTG